MQASFESMKLHFTPSVPRYLTNAISAVPKARSLAYRQSAVKRFELLSICLSLSRASSCEFWSGLSEDLPQLYENSSKIFLGPLLALAPYASLAGKSQHHPSLSISMQQFAWHESSASLFFALFTAPPTL
jgi:hypothetical protein